MLLKRPIPLNLRGVLLSPDPLYIPESTGLAKANINPKEIILIYLIEIAFHHALILK